MPELRRDPIVGRWVIISTERGKRPSDFGQIQPPRKSGFCPFCPGNESKTPPEVFAVPRTRHAARYAGLAGPGRLEQVSRPADRGEPRPPSRGDLRQDERGRGPRGHHRDDRRTRPSSRSSPSRTSILVMQALRERMLDLSKDRRFRYIQVFKNHGEAAGASLEHSHIQLIATPIVPRRVVEELNGCSSHFEMKERCIFCDIVDQEIFAPETRRLREPRIPGHRALRARAFPSRPGSSRKRARGDLRGHDRRSAGRLRARASRRACSASTWR